MEEEKSVESSSSTVLIEKPNYKVLSSLRKPLCVADLGRECLALHYTFGVDMTRRGNLYLIEDEKIIYAIASSVVFEDVKSGQKSFLLGLDEGGVGCVAVHPSRSIFSWIYILMIFTNTFLSAHTSVFFYRNYFAVGCKGFQPKIYIYAYPSLEVRRASTL